MNRKKWQKCFQFSINLNFLSTSALSLVNLCASLKLLQLKYSHCSNVYYALTPGVFMVSSLLEVYHGWSFFLEVSETYEFLIFFFYLFMALHLLFTVIYVCIYVVTLIETIISLQWSLLPVQTQIKNQSFQLLPSSITASLCPPNSLQSQ